MGKIIVNTPPLTAPELKKLAAICPFGAIEPGSDGRPILNAGCKLCGLCTKKAPEIFRMEEDSPAGETDKDSWRGIAVAAETTASGAIHPVSLELLGKARELAGKIHQKVYAFLCGYRLDKALNILRRCHADEIFVYDDPALEFFRIEPFTAALEDFIRAVRPAAVLVGGTPSGRSLAPRTAARFRTGLTADCTKLDIQLNTDLDQIRPAFGGNIMAHIRTPDRRPQFATVRYKIFPLPELSETPGGKIVRRTLSNAQKKSAIKILKLEERPEEPGLEEAEVIVAAGRGVKKQEDLALLRELADALHGQLGGTRCLIENSWLDHRRQIGLSGRTVAPKLILCCGVSGSVQFAAGMKGSQKIIAINTDPDAPIFKIAHIGICADLYEVIPPLLERIRKGGFL